jgi:Sec7-like guanine-nucleotide exchange factor
MNISRETLVLPTRQEGEPPGHYLERIEAENFDKSVIASFLSKTDDAFLLAVLRSYMRRFAFFGDPIDMAVRKLLMQVELPKETQQIDRVLQGFADRYHECNPGIYINTGEPK